ncbi:MAG: hypothetical protein NVS3B12_09620 [Acidimicrobiales bacterium]
MITNKLASKVAALAAGGVVLLGGAAFAATNTPSSPSTPAGDPDAGGDPDTGGPDTGGPDTGGPDPRPDPAQQHDRFDRVHGHPDIGNRDVPDAAHRHVEQLRIH